MSARIVHLRDAGSKRNATSEANGRGKNEAYRTREVAAISSTAPTRTTPWSRSAARTRTAAHIRNEARQSICRNPGHHSASHRYAARFATSCAISCFAASEPARDRARLLLYR
jgi:hypothetical protein